MSSDPCSIKIRRARSTEPEAVASVFRRSRQAFLPYLPDLHTFEEDKAYFRNIVFRDCDVWVADEQQLVVGFCAFKQGWVEHLYLLHGYTGRGIGRKLIAKAQDHFDHLQLWVFQANVDAIAFYERNGFVRIRETDGTDCQEKMPDALYRWDAGVTAGV